MSEENWIKSLKHPKYLKLKRSRGRNTCKQGPTVVGRNFEKMKITKKGFLPKNNCQGPGVQGYRNCLQTAVQIFVREKEKFSGKSIFKEHMKL